MVELQPQEEKTEQSILSKLRAEIESRRDEYRNKKSTKRTSKMTENDKILEIRANEMDIVLLLLNELETQPSQPEEWSPRPQEWIEVCHDEEDIDWIKARFIQKDSAGYYCEYENA